MGETRVDLLHLLEDLRDAYPGCTEETILASRSIGYHIALAVAMALAPLAVESANEHAFVTAFLFRWGEAIDNSRTRKQKKR